jgi:hypothetical protein
MFVSDSRVAGNGSYASPCSTRFGVFALAFFMLPLIAMAQGNAVGNTPQAIALTRPAVTITLNSDAEWRAPQWVEFDQQGHALVLYRDNKKVSRNGNWHLLRISDVLGVSPQKQALTFAPIEEPADPDGNRKWDTANGFLRVNNKGTLAYAVFDGGVVTRKPGPLNVNGLRNIESRSFRNAVAIDLQAFRVVAKRDVSKELDSARSSTVDADGNLLVLRTGEVSWTVTALGPDLNGHPPRVIGVRQGDIYIEGCSLERSEVIQCRQRNEVVRMVPDGKLDFVELKQNWKIDGPLLPSQGDWVVAAYTIDGTQYISDNELWIFNDEGKPTLSTTSLGPICRQGWQASVISQDGKSLLLSCYETKDILDTFFPLARADLQLFDAVSLRLRATLKLSTRSKDLYAVWHGNGQTVIAVLHDGKKLDLYTIADGL